MLIIAFIVNTTPPLPTPTKPTHRSFPNRPLKPFWASAQQLTELVSQLYEMFRKLEKDISTQVQEYYVCIGINLYIFDKSNVIVVE